MVAMVACLDLKEQKDILLVFRPLLFVINLFRLIVCMHAITCITSFDM